ncbi:hypothetical protein [Microbulbifer aggregans]|uniref:hypothetical protein n=1 Tax=Microbulbifer aggregans TaxID=1769779 RepID=UPI001CFC7BE9|nr:hypothetical protein [Microbulbifer aggregans]
MKKFACTILLLLSPFATANEQGYNPFYLKLGYGSTDFDSESFIGYEADSANGYSLTLGFQTNRFLALESSFVSLGELPFSYAYEYSYGEPEWDDYRVESSYAGSGNRSWNTRTIGATLSTDVYRRFSAGLRFGYHKWESQSDVTQSGTYSEYEWNPATDSYELSYSDDYNYEFSYGNSGDGGYYGITLGLNTGNWIFSADYTVYEMDRGDPAMGSVSVGFRI